MACLVIPKALFGTRIPGILNEFIISRNRSLIYIGWLFASRTSGNRTKCNSKLQIYQIIRSTHTFEKILSKHDV